MADNEPQDPLPALIAALDQALEMAPQLARAARGYYDAFLEAGFSEKQALYMAAAQIQQDPGQAP